MEEVWKDVVGYEGIYQVSNLGQLKNIKHNRLLTGAINRYGYVSVVLIKDKKVKNTRMHRLIAETFIPNPKNKNQVNHINGIKTDNRVENLEWVSNHENVIHAWENGLTRPLWKNKFGKNHNRSKEIYQIDKNTNLVIKKFYGCSEAERETGVKRQNIHLCCSGKAKTAGGYKWEFVEKEG